MKDCKKVPPKIQRQKLFLFQCPNEPDETDKESDGNNKKRSNSKVLSPTVKPIVL